jgi:hypothetical protein
MGLTTSLVVCCLTCSSVIVKVRHNRELAECPIWVSPPRRLSLETEEFTPDLEDELVNTGSGRTVCPICCEAFGADGDLELVVLQCSHAYHFLCLEAYAIARPNAFESPLLCPICQKKAASRCLG